MNRFGISILLVTLTLLTGCGQTSERRLSSLAFADKIKATPDAYILDVRTAGEFEGGHINKAINIDWNSHNFANTVSTLDKSKKVLVYCLSGARSTAAANVLRTKGFDVFELQGGLMKWRAAGLPVIGNQSTGLSKQQFETLTQSDKIVLVDFYADWCAPCKKMKPYLDEIARDMNATVEVVQIDADANKQLCYELGIEALPVLHVYKNNTLYWSNVGYVEKAEVIKQLR